MAHETLSDEPIIDGSTPQITYALQNAAGAPVTLATIVTMTATVVSKDTGVAIPNWTDVDIKNQQGNVIDANGNGVWEVPATAMVKALAGESEDIYIYVTCTFGAARVSKHRFEIMLVKDALG